MFSGVTLNIYMQNPAQIAEYRAQHLRKYVGNKSFQLANLERKFGKYMFLPFDIPRIEPANMAQFVRWFAQSSKPIKKIYPDVACSAHGQYDFCAVDSLNQVNTIWTQNKRYDLFQLFPELKVGIDMLPFKNPQYSLWSSINTVYPHRDQGAWEDLPLSFRVMLYDNNPAPTLALMEDTIDEKTQSPLFSIPRISDTNTFGWNNLRTKHSSTYDKQYTKILMIFTGINIDLDRYEDLIIRSIEKYSDHAMISEHDISAFIQS